MNFIDSGTGGQAGACNAMDAQIPAEHMAAIAAAIAMVYTDIPEEHIAVIAAAIAAYDELPAEMMPPILRLRPRQQFWAMSGRQAIMNGRANFQKK